MYMAEVILTADRVTLNEAKKMSKDLIGETAPEFILMDDEGNEFDSRSLDGEWRILFFYAKAGSPTCKRGCLTFKEQHDLFASAGCKVVGVGEGTVESHSKFKKSLGGLPFPLLSDQDRAVADQYLVPVHLGMFPAKSSFLIGPDNQIKHVYDWLFRPRRHVARILKHLSPVTGGDS